MQEIAFSEALKVVGIFYTDSEIAKICGTSRQAVNKWWGMTRQPQRRILAKFWPLYQQCAKKQQQSETKQDECRKLIPKYEHNWNGRISLQEELLHHPEWFVRTRSPWLLFDSFYHFGYNRRGDYQTLIGTNEEPFSGWDTTQQAKDDREWWLKHWRS